MKVRCPQCGEELYAIRTRITIHEIRTFKRGSRGAEDVPYCIFGTELKNERMDNVSELVCLSCNQTYIQEGWEVELPEIRAKMKGNR